MSGNIVSLTHQAARNLAGSPGRMRIPDRQHQSLHFSPAAAGTEMRPARAIFERSVSFHKKAEPFIAGLRANSEPAAEFPPVHSLLQCKLHKLAPLLHDRHLAPRHGSPPW